LRRITCVNILVFLLSLSIFMPVIEDVGAVNGGLVKDAYWTYHVTSRNELQGAGNYTGLFTNTIAVKGRATIVSSNSSTFVIEKREETNFSVDGTGYFKQEPKVTPYNFTERDAVDRDTLTYRARVVRNEVDNSMQQDPAIVGMPAIEFVSTSLTEGQHIPYYSITGRINCTVSLGNADFQGSSLPVIVLHYSGPSAKDPWLETNGTADYTFNFERTTGLLVSSSSKLQATSQKGARVTTSNYFLDSTSLWGSGSTTGPPSSTQAPPTGAVPPTTQSPQKGFAISAQGTVYALLMLVIIAIGIASAAFYRVRRKTPRTKKK
jgi:hypothetical protein